MKIPTDLQPGDIFHIKNWLLGDRAIFRGYVKEDDGTVMADTEATCGYSFNIANGVADPTDIEVIRVQRVNSSGVSEGMQRETDAMIRQERVTKGFIAIELQHLLSQNYYEPHDFKEAIEEYKDKLLKEAKQS